MCGLMVVFINMNAYVYTVVSYILNVKHGFEHDADLNMMGFAYTIRHT